MTQFLKIIETPGKPIFFYSVMFLEHLKSLQNLRWAAFFFWLKYAILDFLETKMTYFMIFISILSETLYIIDILRESIHKKHHLKS